MSTTRVDGQGVWRIEDDGLEMLIEPSPAYLARKAEIAVELDQLAADQVEPDPVAVAAEAIRDEITTRLAPSGVNSIAEVKAAVIEGLDAAVARLS